MGPIPVQAVVLVIDDDLKLLGLFEDYLPRFHIQVLTAPDPEAGLRLLGSSRPDLVVLDVMLPGIDGFEVCRMIRKHDDVPILMLSARGDAMDKIVGLELGADDYMAKPFEPRELVTRIQTILRRSGGRRVDPGPRFGDFEVRTREREVYRDGLALGFSSMEFELLLLLAQNRSKKFSREEIMNQIQGFEAGAFSRSIDILVSRIRAKLGEDARKPRYIKSVHGFGYVFVGESP